MTARMHVASANAFGLQEGDAAAWAGSMRRDLKRFAGEAWAEAAAVAADRLAAAGDAGRAVRVHGDYHLGQVIRTDTGWYVLDFEGEPARPPVERRRLLSPMKDVAGMLRSLQYAAQVGLGDREAEERTGLQPLADAWEKRNREAFLEGYYEVTDVHDLLPQDEHARRALLTGFEVEKAVYEVGYERDHRPDWEHIPRAAIDRLTNPPTPTPTPT
jgi:trehalose synthase-fused probable maltokinase